MKKAQFFVGDEMVGEMETDQEFPAVAFATRQPEISGMVMDNEAGVLTYQREQKVDRFKLVSVTGDVARYEPEE